MKISYAITVCNEFVEIQRLITFLLQNKRIQDEIVVLIDLTKNKSTSELLGYLHKLSSSNSIILLEDNFDKHFANWKNKLGKSCSGDYIFQIDADEIPHVDLVKILPNLLDQNPEVDMFMVPRINVVTGITQEHIVRWGWNVNEKGWINFPDYQTRIYKNNSDIKWEGNVHERITGTKTFSPLPTEEYWCLYHPKDIERQEKQNQLYETI